MSIGIDVVNVGVSNSSCFFILSICNKQKKIKNLNFYMKQKWSVKVIKALL